MAYDYRGLLENAFRAAHASHKALGERGLEQIRKNEHGDTALAVDIECERAVIEVLRDSGLRFRVHSEEHGILDLHPDPEALAVLDGIDGTAVYTENRLGGEYATLLTLYPTVNPRYRDFAVAGMMQHAFGRMVIAEPEKGVVSQTGDIAESLHCAPITDLSGEPVIFADDHFPYVSKNLSGRFTAQGYVTSYLKCTALYYWRMVSGRGAVILECTRKGNLEIAAGYALITAGGGSMLTIDGSDLGSESFMLYGQKDHTGIISVASPALKKRVFEVIYD